MSILDQMGAKVGSEIKLLNDNKVDNSRVLTNVPGGAVFTDTINGTLYELPGVGNTAKWFKVLRINSNAANKVIHMRFFGGTGYSQGDNNPNGLSDLILTVGNNLTGNHIPNVAGTIRHYDGSSIAVTDLVIERVDVSTHDIYVKSPIYNAAKMEVNLGTVDATVTISEVVEPPYLNYVNPNVINIGGSTDFDAGHSFTGNGYQKLSNGLIIQWGESNVTAGNIREVTFPITFPNTILQLLVTPFYATTTSNSYIHRINQHASGFSVGSSLGTPGVSYYAVGY